MRSWGLSSARILLSQWSLVSASRGVKNQTSMRHWPAAPGPGQ